MNLNDNNHTFTATKATIASNAAASLAGAAFIIMMSYMGAVQASACKAVCPEIFHKLFWVWGRQHTTCQQQKRMCRVFALYGLLSRQAYPDK